MENALRKLRFISAAKNKMEIFLIVWCLSLTCLAVRPRLLALGGFSFTVEIEIDFIF